MIEKFKDQLVDSIPEDKIEKKNVASHYKSEINDLYKSKKDQQFINRHKSKMNDNDELILKK